MGSDSVSLPKELGKKNRGRKMAKLKQSKLDVRREQWLSQVKNKGCNLDLDGRGESPLSVQINKKLGKSVDNLELQQKEVENKSSGIKDCELESLMSSSVESSLGHNCSGTSISSGSCSTSSGCFSGSVTEEEENDGCFDDWEAVADAMNEDSEQSSAVKDSSSEPKASDGSARFLPSDHNPEEEYMSTEASREPESKSRTNCQAWRADDAFRPQCLPCLPKQSSFSMDSEWQNSSANIAWSSKSTVAQPSSCPICYEDLDITDSRFLPCPCGFRLCLFCHKQILEADARCPGCRKHYDSTGIDTSFSGDPAGS